jgi:hypothetical protein
MARKGTVLLRERPFCGYAIRRGATLGAAVIAASIATTMVPGSSDGRGACGSQHGRSMPVRIEQSSLTLIYYAILINALQRLRRGRRGGHGGVYPPG